MLKTFDQRYVQNNNFVRDPQKVKTAIISISGEAEMKKTPGGTFDKPKDVLGDIAKKYNAPIFELEHRFYGESQPFLNYSENYLSNENLVYLSSQFAISDLIFFMAAKDKEYCALTQQKFIPGKPCLKWMLVGGSYAGAVAAWMTQQHQSWFAATIASSGVVDARYELPEFDTHTLEAAGTPCSHVYLEAMHQIEAATEAGDDQYLKLFKAENAVHADFYYFLADTSLMALQYGDWSGFCKQLLIPAYEDNKDLVEIFADYLHKNYEYRPYDRNDLKIPNNKQSSARQWWYQTCTEFAFYQPAPIRNSIRSQQVTIQWHLDVCKAAFDLELGDVTQRTNIYNGRLDVYGQETFFSNFWQDVWHICGITAPTTHVSAENIGYIAERDVGHCEDIHEYRDDDPPLLKALRLQEINFVSQKFDEWNAR